MPKRVKHVKSGYNPEAWKQDSTSSFGQSGITRTDGGFAQDEIIRKLQFPQGMNVYREMKDNDPIVGAMLFAINSIYGCCYRGADQSNNILMAHNHNCHTNVTKNQA